jgi:hypothetical protein
MRTNTHGAGPPTLALAVSVFSLVFLAAFFAREMLGYLPVSLALAASAASAGAETGFGMEEVYGWLIGASGNG